MPPRTLQQPNSVITYEHIRIIKIPQTILMQWSCNYIHAKNVPQRPQVWTIDYHWLITIDVLMCGCVAQVAERSLGDHKVENCSLTVYVSLRASWWISSHEQGVATTGVSICWDNSHYNKIKVLLFLVWTSSSEGFRSFFLLPGRNFFMGRGLLLESWRSATSSLMLASPYKTHIAAHTV